MKFYKHWARAAERVRLDSEVFNVVRYGWSNVGAGEALEKARELCAQTANIFKGGAFPDTYLYSDVPLREEIIKSFGDQQQPYAVITRNSYGCQVLNTSRVLFADVDLPPEQVFPSLKQLILGIAATLFGAPVKSNSESESDRILGEIGEFVKESPGLGMRVYRTAAGFRCIETTREYDPVSEETGELLEYLGSDPLYAKLCNVQECFRARLTPKCWRLGFEKPSARFPWANDAEEKAMLAWEKQYQELSTGFSTCEFIKSFGSDVMHPNVAPIVHLHDELCCRPGLPLA